jgi:hypothetical protein
MSAVARCLSAQSGVRSTSGLCRASSIAAVRVATRVSDTRRAIAVPVVGDGRQGGASHRLGVWTHHPPRGRAWRALFSPVNTCPVSGLPPSRLRGATLVFTRQLMCLL